MKKNNFRKSCLALSTGCLLIGASTNAAEFYLGENNDILIQVTSQLSIGASWRLQDIDPTLVAAVNGGLAPSNTTDDGNLNFEKHETFSKIIKGVHDINISKDDIGAFVRFKYWYDRELQEESRPHGHINNSYVAGAPLNDNNFSDNALFSSISLLDAYVYGAFDFGDVPVDIRLGRQVISWGESTFIQGGINTTNPFDVSALRRPGAELKEGLLPVGMLYFNAGLTENLSIEAYYQYEWAKTEVDGCGTLFSTADFVSDGCMGIPVGASFYQSDAAALQYGFSPTRLADVEPDDGGQFGLAARYYAPELNDTEFGIYYLKYHSRLPMIMGVRSGWHDYAPIPFVPWVVGYEAYNDHLAWLEDPVNNPFNELGYVLTSSGANGDRVEIDTLNPHYGMTFPEGMELFGFSFATNIGGLALSGEISYKPDVPVQINGNHLLAGALRETASIPFTARVQASEPGEIITGFDTFDVTQIQVTAIQFFDQVLGASRMSVAAEAGVVMTDGIEDMASQGYYYGRNPLFGLTLPGFDIEGGGEGGFVTDTAWGYRIKAALDYPDVFAGVALKPIFTWTHDVSGYAPEPGAQFREGQKSISFALEASYLQKYTATIAYKTFSGDDYSTLKDKDFVSLSFGMSY